MRHFCASGTITALPLGMRTPTRRAVLIAASGRPHQASTRLLGTARATVALTPIAVAANHHRLGTTRTVITSSRIHGLKRADGECCGDLRSVGYFACNVARLGCGARHRMCFEAFTDVAPAFPSAKPCSTASAPPRLVQAQLHPPKNRLAAHDSRDRQHPRPNSIR